MHNNHFQNGYAGLISLLVTLTVSLTVILGMTFFTLQEVGVQNDYQKSLASRAASAGGIEDALYRIISGKQIGASETLTVGSSTATIIVTNYGSYRIVRAEGVRDTVQQNTETRIDFTTTSAQFFYGEQVGDGGLNMQNSSTITGSVFSNGSIVGSNSPTITGDAFVAGGSQISGMTINGNAQGHSISNSTIEGYASSTTLLDTTTVGKDAHVSSLQNSTITKDAYYQNIDNQTVVLGVRHSNTVPPSDLAGLSMPINDTQLDAWETEAAAGGTINGPCPYSPSDGDTLGPVKINCDVIIDGKTVVTLGGPVWIVGSLTMQNSAILKLASSFGDKSSVLIADDPAHRGTEGTISVQNSSQVQGSGTLGSYIMLVARNTSMEQGGSVVAITVANSSSACVYYAPHGKLSISNNTSLKEATAYGIEMGNGSNLTYESGLQNIKFSSGPSGGYSVKYWKQAE